MDVFAFSTESFVFIFRVLSLIFYFVENLYLNQIRAAAYLLLKTPLHELRKDLSG